MNIVYGGSFNPVTLAHEAIVKKLHQQFNPEHIIIIPTANNYTRKELISFKDRYQMLKMVFKDEIILDLENQNEVYKGTFDTLNKLSKTYNDLYFCMGADNIVDIKTWINWTELLKNYHFIVFGRDHVDVLKFIEKNLYEYKDHIHFIDMDMDVSSTNFRNNMHDFKDTVSKEVLEYIKKNHLYEVGE